MNTFFRVLSYANKLNQRLVLFFGFSFLGIIFGAFNIVLVMPMLDTLFNQTQQTATVPPLPEFQLSVNYVVGVFNHYFIQIVVSRGALDALLFVCALIVTCVILANLFR
jgi:ATP-binding cassette, subfamily B, bacterial MsbA